VVAGGFDRLSVIGDKTFECHTPTNAHPTKRVDAMLLVRASGESGAEKDGTRVRSLVIEGEAIGR